MGGGGLKNVSTKPYQAVHNFQCIVKRIVLTIGLTPLCFFYPAVLKISLSTRVTIVNLQTLFSLKFKCRYHFLRSTFKMSTTTQKLVLQTLSPIHNIFSYYVAPKSPPWNVCQEAHLLVLQVSWRVGLNIPHQPKDNLIFYSIYHDHQFNILLQQIFLAFTDNHLSQCARVIRSFMIIKI